MTNQETKNLLTTFIDEVWNQYNLDNLDEYAADNYVEHTPFGDFQGIDEFRGFISINLRGFPDFSVTLENIVADENFVAANYITSGTHEEEYLGIEATGKSTNIHGCYLARVENGKLVEGWNQFDALSLLTSLEIISPDTIGNLQEGVTGQGQSGTRQ